MRSLNTSGETPNIDDFEPLLSRASNVFRISHKRTTLKYPFSYQYYPPVHTYSTLPEKHDPIKEMLSAKSTSSSKSNEASAQILFKKNRQKARKSVHVLALTASVGALVASPSIFSHLPFTNKPLTTKSNLSSHTVEKVSNVSLSTGLAASRRAKSMSILHKPNDPSSNDKQESQFHSSKGIGASSSPHSLRRNLTGKPSVTFAEQPEELVFRQPVSLPVFEDDMDQFDFEEEEKSQMDNSRDSQAIGGMLGMAARQPERVTLPMIADRRRIQSAPSVYLQQQPITSFAPELLDDPVDDTFDQELDGLELNEWLVASVKAKAVQNAEKQKLKDELEVENWDEDFVVDQERLDDENQDATILKIPEHLEQIQVNLKVDMLNMRKFALHMEDLRLLYLDAQDIEAGLIHDGIRAAGDIKRKYETILHYASTLLDIADCTTEPGAVESNDGEPSPLSTEHMHTLANILAGPGGLDGKDKTFESLASSGSKVPVPAKLGATEKGVLETMLQDGHVNFGNEWMPMLLVRVGPIKQHLAHYVAELRRLAVSN